MYSSLALNLSTACLPSIRRRTGTFEPFETGCCAATPHHWVRELLLAKHMNKPRKQPNQYTVKRDKPSVQAAKEAEPADKVQALPSIAELTAKRDLLIEQLGNIEKQVRHSSLQSFVALWSGRLIEGDRVCKACTAR